MTIFAKAGEEVLYKAKKQFVNPGEMEQINVKKENLALAGGSDITVSIERNEV